MGMQGETCMAMLMGGVGGGGGAGGSEGGAMGREMSRGVRQLHTQIRWADAEARERAMP
jgi:hypothetical protein